MGYLMFKIDACFHMKITGLGEGTLKLCEMAEAFGSI